MDRKTAFAGPEIKLKDILEMKDRRVLLQRQMLKEHENSLISFSVMMAGPVKQNEMSRFLFSEGLKEIRKMLDQRNVKISKEHIEQSPGGDTALISCDIDSMKLKKLCMELEQDIPFGRLLDIDVISSEGNTITRAMANKESRCCIVCGKNGSGCARSRAHGVNELLDAIWSIDCHEGN